MKKLLATTVIFSSTIAGIFAQTCTGTAEEIHGNWYCQAVDAISYLNFGKPGTYDKVTSFNADGSCGFTSQSYQGGISPLNEELSFHMRGPLVLKQFAFYAPGFRSKAKPRRDMKTSPHKQRHAHKHSRLHDERDNEEKQNKRAPCKMITVTVGEQVESWMDNYMCDPVGASTPTEAPATDDPRIAPGAVSTIAEVAAASTSAMPTMNVRAGNWGRQAYYNAESSIAEGLVFLNHKGGEGSGVFDYIWGNSLSYASADAKTGATGPEVLADVMLDDTAEIVIMSDKICADNCGTVRPGTTAYHGFYGADKVFLVEFSMPLTGKNPGDTPAIWTLNAQIPNTVQYGECSCWASGCGEWDIFEVLDPGNTRAKSTFHGNPSGGDSNYFTRPTTGTIKAAVIFEGDSSAGHIVLLASDVTFDATIANSVVAGYLNQMADPSMRVKFDLASI